jgi:hypothetical protein
VSCAKARAQQADTYVVTLVELPAPVTGIVRIKRLLKTLLRAYGLKCIGIRRAER